MRFLREQSAARYKEVVDLTRVLGAVDDEDAVSRQPFAGTAQLPAHVLGDFVDPVEHREIGHFELQQHLTLPWVDERNRPKGAFDFREDLEPAAQRIFPALTESLL